MKKKNAFPKYISVSIYCFGSQQERCLAWTLVWVIKRFNGLYFSTRLNELKSGSFFRKTLVLCRPRGRGFCQAPNLRFLLIWVPSLAIILKLVWKHLSPVSKCPLPPIVDSHILQNLEFSLSCVFFFFFSRLSDWGKW